MIDATKIYSDLTGKNFGEIFSLTLTHAENYLFFRRNYSYVL